MVKPKSLLSVKIGKIELKNPIMVASGTFGYAKEYEDIVDVKKLGAIVTKTITNEPRSGNPPPRITETASGMLNSIGLENDGVEAFIEKKLPYLKRIGAPLIVSIGGERPEAFVRLARRLNGVKGIAGLEVNISCPNLKRSRHRLFSQERKATRKVIKKIRKATSLTLITKLTPNVTDIAEIAKAAEGAGSDAISVVNTYMGMAVDIESKRPLLGNITGGLSGPAIKPLALKAVWDVCNSVDIPVIGMGGIMSLDDVVEFILCGATAVALGSVNFVHPERCVKIIKELGDYIKSNKIGTIDKLIGGLNVKQKA